MYSYALVSCSKEKCGRACFLLREGKYNAREEMQFKKVFFLYCNIFFCRNQAHMAAGAGICIPGSDPGLIELLDAYEKLHMGVWDGNSAAYVRVLAVDIIWDYVNRNWSCFPQNKKSKVISLAKIRPARSVCGAPNNTCYLIDKKKSTLSSAFHSECITLQERNKTSFCLLP